MNKAEINSSISRVRSAEDSRIEQRDQAWAEKERLAIARVTGLEERFPAVVDLSQRNRAIHSWAVKLVGAVKNNKPSVDGRSHCDVGVILGEAESWPGKHTFVRIKQDRFGHKPTTFETQVGELGYCHWYGGNFQKDGLIEGGGITATLATETTYGITVGEPNSPFSLDRIYEKMLVADELYDSFEQTGGVFHPVEALRKGAAVRKGTAPSTPEIVLSGIHQNITALESTQAMMVEVMHNPELNPAIAEALANVQPQTC